MPMIISIKQSNEYMEDQFFLSFNLEYRAYIINMLLNIIFLGVWKINRQKTLPMFLNLK